MDAIGGCAIRCHHLKLAIVLIHSWICKLFGTFLSKNNTAAIVQNFKLPAICADCKINTSGLLCKIICACIEVLGCGIDSQIIFAFCQALCQTCHFDWERLWCNFSAIHLSSNICSSSAYTCRSASAIHRQHLCIIRLPCHFLTTDITGILWQ